MRSSPHSNNRTKRSVNTSLCVCNSIQLFWTIWLFVLISGKGRFAQCKIECRHQSRVWSKGVRANWKRRFADSALRTAQLLGGTATGISGRGNWYRSLSVIVILAITLFMLILRSLTRKSLATMKFRKVSGSSSIKNWTTSIRFWSECPKRSTNIWIHMRMQCKGRSTMQKHPSIKANSWNCTNRRKETQWHRFGTLNTIKNKTFLIFGIRK